MKRPNAPTACDTLAEEANHGASITIDWAAPCGSPTTLGFGPEGASEVHAYSTR